MQAHPRIELSDPLLNSAFGQYPELINAMELSDTPGAVRANFDGYYVWVWNAI